MKIGYARVSPAEQNLAKQLAALHDAGAEQVFIDENVSGSAVFKEEWIKAKEHARPGDEIIIWRLDRLSRSTRELIVELDALRQTNVIFRSLHENIAAATDEEGGLFHFIGALVGFDLCVLSDRRAEWAIEAQLVIGRPPVAAEDKWAEYLAQIKAGKITPARVAKEIGVSRQAVHSRIKRGC